ncbi:MAG TPA: 30S ribosomal protein S17 [Enteractinococcus sp.]
MTVTESVETAAAPERNYRKTLRGVVVSDKMDKTIVVEIEYFKQHALYGKIMRRTKRVSAHDEENTAGIGDIVRLAETRPLSKTKHWRLTDIIERAK